MKKLIALLLAVLMLFSLCACNKDADDTSDDVNSAKEDQQDDPVVEKLEEDVVDWSKFETVDDVKAYLGTFMDLSQYGPKMTTYGDADIDERDLAEMTYATIDSEITIRGTKFNFPLAANEDSTKIVGYDDMSITNYEEYYIGGEPQMSVTCSDNDGNLLTIAGPDKEHLGRFSISATDENNDFVYMGKITNKATPKTVVSMLGLPQNVQIKKYVSPTGLVTYCELRFIYRNEDGTRSLQFDFSGKEDVSGLQNIHFKVVG